MSAEPWYAAGLRFSCTRCGGCCTGEPGYVWLEAAEAQALAAQLGLTLPGFLAAWTRRVDGRLSLREAHDGACVLFVPGAGCRAYAQRPRQCRSWPFWRRNLVSPAAWEREAADCPGMGSGERVDCATIEQIAGFPGLPRRGELP